MRRFAVAVVALVLVASAAFAGKTYQFTGKVLDQGQRYCGGEGQGKV